MAQDWKTAVNGQQRESSAWKTCFGFYGSEYAKYEELCLKSIQLEMKKEKQSL